MEKEEIIPRRKAGLLERDTGDAVVVMTENGDVVHTLQGTALFIWRLIDGNTSFEMILTKVMEDYAVSREKAISDITVFFKSLSEQDLIS